ncbi:helix-turn-helix domain-containing protein [Geodermatophilus sp. YIM 151500]|uniref:helix-turn-helix domain-containing protein n=1 Tax=Geodermatophilus sp. YIM 151500 TaxID=2984531 RepID=UPI0021E4B2BE|nr:helix-turn-helix domain-containing protein [Geodermatophilus sp. YIM 151500]MCV2490954.1 helix-turn-helix domain-containing protein [Geodermatophilus sp. YIM 151500]
MDAEPLGQVVRGLRLAADLTLEGLSEASGISARALSDIERGAARAPQHRTMLAIAQALDLPEADRAALLQAARDGRRRPQRAPSWRLPLPRDTADFTGREAELASVTAALTGARAARSPLVVVTGPPGYGKTSVAVRASARLRSAFPDQLFVDLGGVTHEPPSPRAVADRVLGALLGRESTGHDTGYVRELLAERQRLLVLDDAASESQIRALRPTTGPTALLVTSRRSLAGLDEAGRVPLDRLPSSDARQVLAAIIPAEQAAQTDLARLARLCDHVPLALRIAGNRVASRPGWTAAGLVERLAVREHRLDALTAGDLQIRAAIRSSVDQLGPAARRLFRRLALVDEPTVPAGLAAALVGEPRWRAEDVLDELADLNLVQPAPGDRYALRGLLRLYAEAELATHESRAARAAARAAADQWRRTSSGSPGQPGPGVRREGRHGASPRPPVRLGRRHGRRQLVARS